MDIKLYNTKTKKKEIFKPLKDEVGFYSCGPTVYNYAHLGNMRTYIFNDLLYRVLKSKNYKIKHVINITDVGHLTDDADDGEDKMEKGAKREGKTVEEIAQFYIDAFQSDWKKLNLHTPQIWCRATQHIPEMIRLIKTLEQNGYTYQSGGNIYFDTSKFKDYTKFARLKLDNLENGSRIEIDKNKKNPTDFVLWFTLGNSKFGDTHTMKWESPWGVGYPGWHVECSAMSMKYLGDEFDIHTGGIDHIPVHHTNEIAQSRGVTQKDSWVKYWLHGNFLVAKDGKMSKSSGEFLRVDLLEKKGYDPLIFRYYCLNTHYRKELMFSWQSLDNIKKSFDKLKSKIIEIKKLKNKKEKTGIEYENKFYNAIYDDLNLPQGLGIMWDLINDKSIDDKAKLNSLYKFDEILGLDFKNIKSEEINISDEVKEILKKRRISRENKEWNKSDELRNKIKKLGFLVKDTKEGQKIEKI